MLQVNARRNVDYSVSFHVDKQYCHYRHDGAYCRGSIERN